MSHWYRDHGKRLLDLIAVGGTLPLWLPAVALLAVFVRLVLGRPVWFRQERPGLQGRPFQLVKFRTMTGTRDPSGRLLPDGDRMTKVGDFLRSTSLDELPELWHVLTGRMSLVGPRPLLLQYLPHYSASEFRRHAVRPGITGWAQINGRNQQTWEERFTLDLWYVDHVCLALDIRILCTTLVKLVRREGIRQIGHATMPRLDATRGWAKTGREVERPE
jgi:lipopolysaccharide/colanic/teichoic acid biosynthesis glycosyltransferase